MSERNVYLVGSIPLSNASEVFERVSSALGDTVKRIPDGETGERSDWITWLERIFSSNPSLQRSDEVFRVHAGAAAYHRYTLKPGRTVADLRFEDLQYARIAQASYAEFARLKQAGKIPARTRFQVDLVPAHSVLWLFVVEELQAQVDPIYNEAVKREIDKIAATIPHSELAIQFDVASAVFARLERNDASRYGRDKHESRERFAQIVADLANHVPADIELLFHFCYGDANHKHAVEPTDMGDMVDFAHSLVGKLRRSVELIHMPVPRNRSDNAYFQPLSRLRLPKETELCLGLVHYTDGLEGTRCRLETAQKHAREFSIATECGFGRRPVETIPALLRIHKDAAAIG